MARPSLGFGCVVQCYTNQRSAVAELRAAGSEGGAAVGPLDVVGAEGVGGAAARPLPVAQQAGPRQQRQQQQHQVCHHHTNLQTSKIIKTYNDQLDVHTTYY